MSKLRLLLCLVGLSLSVSPQAYAVEKTLTFKQAIALAISRGDPSVAQFTARAEAMRASAVADAQLPDPKIKFGVANLAADSFRFDQEPMTQMQFLFLRT